MIAAPRFTLAEFEAANDAWSANCGPGALAAICGLTPGKLQVGDAHGTKSQSLVCQATDGQRQNHVDDRLGQGNEHSGVHYSQTIESGMVRLSCGHDPSKASFRCRPCVLVGCRHALYLDVNPESGSLKVNFPDLEPWELKHTCALDVAELGGITLEEVAEILNLTRERIRQVEVRGLLKLKMGSPSPDELGADLVKAARAGEVPR